jgi:hypothetical protein
MLTEPCSLHEEFILRRKPSVDAFDALSKFLSCLSRSRSINGTDISMHGECDLHERFGVVKTRHEIFLLILREPQPRM